MHGPIYLQELVKLQQNGAYNLRTSNKGLMLQAPRASSYEPGWPGWPGFRDLTLPLNPL